MSSTKRFTSVMKYLWVAVRIITTMFVNISSFTRRTKESQNISDDKIALQAEYICEKYIRNKFSQNGIHTRQLQGINPRLRTEEICSEDIVTTMQKYGKILENGFPALYSNITQQLNFRVNIDLVVCGVFTCVCDNILASGITWAKIVSMYAFAAALATDCSQDKDLRIARSISRWMGQYTHKRLCTWIREHGGWDGFASYFDKNACIFSSGNNCSWFNKEVIALTGSLMALIFTTAVAFQLTF